MKRSIFKHTASSSLTSDYNYTTNHGLDFKLISVGVNFENKYSGIVEVRIDSGTGENYDTHILDMRITDHNDFYFTPSNEVVCSAGDEIRVTVEANSGNTAYLTIIGEEV